MGSMRGQTHASMGNETLKMRAWLSSKYFHKQFPAHFAEVLCALPLKDYMDPESGLLNLAAELQTKDISADIGPYVYISYSSTKDHIQAQSVSKLSCDLCDMVCFVLNFRVLCSSLWKFLESRYRQNVLCINVLE